MIVTIDPKNIILHVIKGKLFGTPRVWIAQYSYFIMKLIISMAFYKKDITCDNHNHNSYKRFMYLKIKRTKENKS